MQLVGERVIAARRHEGSPLRTSRRSRSASAFRRPSSSICARWWEIRATTSPASKGIGAEGRRGADPAVGRPREPARACRRGAARSARARPCSQQAEQARLSKRLATLRTDVPLPQGLEAAARREPDLPRLRALVREARLLAAARGPGGRGVTRRGGGRPRASAASMRRAIWMRWSPSCGLCPESRSPVVFGDAPPMSSGPAGLAFALGPERRRLPPARGRGAARHRATSREVVARLRGLFEGARALPWSARETKPLQVWLAEAGPRSRRAGLRRRARGRGCSIRAARARSRRSRRSGSGPPPCAPGKSWPAAAPRPARRARSRSTSSRPGPRRRRAPRDAWRSHSPASSWRPAWTRSTAARSSR